MMIDTHCHVDLFSDPLATAREAEVAGVLTVAVTNLPSHFEQGTPHLAGFKCVRLALGLHPMMVSQHRRERSLFERAASNTSYIGEVGLDFSSVGRATKDAQVDSFRFVLGVIRDRPRFLSLHSRGAELVVMDLLAEYAISPAVFHWYSGPLAAIERALSDGHFFSVNPSMTASQRGRSIIEKIPPERILTESDGPHIRVRGNPVGPTGIGSLLNSIADIWGVSPEKAEAQVQDNFRKVISPLKRQ